MRSSIQYSHSSFGISNCRARYWLLSVQYIHVQLSKTPEPETRKSSIRFPGSNENPHDDGKAISPASHRISPSPLNSPSTPPQTRPLKLNSPSAVQLSAAPPPQRLRRERLERLRPDGNGPGIASLRRRSKSRSAITGFHMANCSLALRSGTRDGLINQISREAGPPTSRLNGALHASR